MSAVQGFVPTYPAPMNNSVNPDQYESVVDVFNQAVAKYAHLPAFNCMGHQISYKALDDAAACFANWLQNESGLQPGDRIAVQLPNILQYPAVVFGAMRAGMVVVNTNPLYTEREMEHQFNDSGAKLLVVYAGMADKAVNVQPKTAIEKVIVTELADFMPQPKRFLLNAAVKHLKKMVPQYDKSKTLSLLDVLNCRAKYQPVNVTRDDIAVLQYTGGTTGVAKGAMLSHRNLIANMQQGTEYFKLALEYEKESIVAPLPLYHIYAFTVHCLVILSTGNENVLIPNPRDIPGFIKTLKKLDNFTAMAGLNTLFNALMNHPDFDQVDFSDVKLTISGGMALTHHTAELWQQRTGCEICEGYGLTETAPVVAFNPPGHNKVGYIGLVTPGAEVYIDDGNGQHAGFEEAGELCVRGPQVMKGYWQRPQDTAHVMSEDGWFKTGDIAQLGEDGYIKIVDRKKDMIIVSGFNVYPNEVEDALAEHDAILECAAIGVPDEQSGEAVKAFVVVKHPVTTDELIAHCRKHLTAYKVPRQYEFVEELPKTAVGKILRRALRDEAS